MRILLIVGLLLSALTMSVPMAASAGTPTVDCHAMMDTDDHAPADNDGADYSAATHSCSGCAFLAASARITAKPPRPALPVDIAMASRRPSLASAPLSPPPRHS